MAWRKLEKLAAMASGRPTKTGMIADSLGQPYYRVAYLADNSIL